MQWNTANFEGSNGYNLKCYNPVRNAMVLIPRIELCSDVKKEDFYGKEDSFQSNLHFQ